VQDCNEVDWEGDEFDYKSEMDILAKKQASAGGSYFNETKHPVALLVF
jgi:hypothetical protein